MEAWLRVDDANVGHHRLSKHSSNVTSSKRSLQRWHIIELHHLGCESRVHWGSDVAGAWRNTAVRPAAQIVVQRGVVGMKCMLTQPTLHS
jgi:hypothetical protein